MRNNKMKLCSPATHRSQQIEELQQVIKQWNILQQADQLNNTTKQYSLSHEDKCKCMLCICGYFSSRRFLCQFPKFFFAARVVEALLPRCPIFCQPAGQLILRQNFNCRRLLHYKVHRCSPKKLLLKILQNFWENLWLESLFGKAIDCIGQYLDGNPGNMKEKPTRKTCFSHI